MCECDTHYQCYSCYKWLGQHIIIMDRSNMTAAYDTGKRLRTVYDNSYYRIALMIGTDVWRSSSNRVTTILSVFSSSKQTALFTFSRGTCNQTPRANNQYLIRSTFKVCWLRASSWALINGHSQCWARYSLQIHQLIILSDFVRIFVKQIALKLYLVTVTCQTLATVHFLANHRVRSPAE